MPWLQQLSRFGLVGLLILPIDMGLVWLLSSGFGWAALPARLVSFAVALTLSWWCNRHFTFQVTANQNLWSEWLRFAAANSLGGAVNYGVYSALVLIIPWFAAQPAWAVPAGVAAGFLVNFVGSRWLVFKHPAKK